MLMKPFARYLVCIALLIWFVMLISCKRKTPVLIDSQPFLHTCPENGHGDCPICCDPYKNEKTIALDR